MTTGEVSSRVVVQPTLPPQLLLKGLEADHGTVNETASLLGHGVILPVEAAPSSPTPLEPLPTAASVMVSC